MTHFAAYEISITLTLVIIIIIIIIIINSVVIFHNQQLLQSNTYTQEGQ